MEKQPVPPAVKQIAARESEGSGKGGDYRAITCTPCQRNWDMVFAGSGR